MGKPDRGSEAFTADEPLRFALVWRGDPTAPAPAPETTRLHLIFAELAELGATAEPVVWDETALAPLRERLLGFDGVLVWVDPLSEGRDRSRLDALLREIAAAGVWVSAHPDVILKMGVKEVLFRTRGLGWGADTDLYRTAAELRAGFPVRLAAGPRVLKQNRGNGGQGVWKVELAGRGDDPPVRVLHAQRGSAAERLPLSEFMARCEAYFDGQGRIIDQPFLPHLHEGMTRCYLAQDRVVGYGHQLVKALVDPPPGREPEPPGPRIMHPPEARAFQTLRRRLEDAWVPAMQALLEIETADLPALWDADFLLGPRLPDGADTYVLCEINVSAVAPYPDSAAPAVARAAIEGAAAARARRASIQSGDRR